MDSSSGVNPKGDLDASVWEDIPPQTQSQDELDPAIWEDVPEEPFQKGFSETYLTYPYLFAKGLQKGTTLGASESMNDWIASQLPKEERGAIQVSQEGKESWTYWVGEQAGALMPISVIHKAFSAPLGYLASKSPVMQRTATSMANLLSAGFTGATVKGAEDLFSGKDISADEMIEHGGMWILLDMALNTAGKMLKFGKMLAKPVQKHLRKAEDVLSTIFDQKSVQSASNKGPEAFVKEVESALKRTEPYKVKPFQEKLSEVREKSAPGEFQYEKPAFQYPEFEPVAEPIKPSEELPGYKPQPEPVLPEPPHDLRAADGLPERPATRKQLGETIQRDVQEAHREARAESRERYESFRENAQGVEYNASPDVKSMEELSNQLTHIEELPIDVRPAGYTTLMNTLRTAIGNLQNRARVPINYAVELKKRLSDLVNYEVVEPNVKERIKPIIAQMRDRIYQTLRQNNRALYDDLVAADRHYAQTAGRFGNDAVLPIRTSDFGEKVSKAVESPTALQHIKQIVTPETGALIDRELLEVAHEASPGTRRRMLREWYPYLGKEAREAAHTRQLAQETVQAQKAHHARQMEAYKKTEAQRKEAHKKSLKNQKRQREFKYAAEKKEHAASEAKRKKEYAEAREKAKGPVEERQLRSALQKASKTGVVPSSIKEAWQNPSGRKLIRKSLKGSPHAENVINRLEEETFHGLVKKVIKDDDTINGKALRSLIGDKAFMEAVQETGGARSVNFLKGLEKISNAILRNSERIFASGAQIKAGAPKGESLLRIGKRKNMPKLERFINTFDSIGIPGKVVMSLLGASSFGVLPAAGGALTIGVLMKMLRNRRVQDAMMEAAKHNISSERYINAIMKMVKGVEEKD